ncbi:sigma 54-interacting transcriptional regulator [Psychrobacter sp. I-STPA6b]|uniref:sigma 54-interacting transcriptional regulator n=1 Tax=Psychrobacter sp. I-STPA6b TaxID=2585718 RepID=UPI001D0C3BCA|nr:sigma 54-interacting transcriptional regulator [Psychrobacter sp. I-STPA6b]
MNNSATLWLIDDDPALRLILEDTFHDAGLNVIVFSNAKGAWVKLNDIEQNPHLADTLPDVILTDIRMPMMDGLSFSDWVHQHFPKLPIIIMTAHSDLQSAVDSYQTGAFDYLPKPFDLDDAVTIIFKAIHKNKDKQPTSSPNNTKKDFNHKKIENPNSINNSDIGRGTDNKNNTAKHNKKNNRQPLINKATADKREAPASQINDIGIIGQSVAMQTVFRAIGRLSNSPITVLITGESGTGKELVANALHQHSPRKNKPFIALNMAAIPHDLIESELFGHEKGAFTGATTQRQGRFEQANGGTLFLDEIGDMPFSTQTRLLRVLANGEFFRVGGQKPIKVDVRIIAATHQNLEQLVKQGKFREDLYYRLNVIRLPLPPLRERPDDIPALVEHFLQQSAKEMNCEQKQLSDDAMQVMQAFDWSGNVRQLENACRWITVMATGDVVMIDDLPPELMQFINSHPHTLTPTSDLSNQDAVSVQHKAVQLTTHEQQENKVADDNRINNSKLTTIQIGTKQTWQQALQNWATHRLQSGQTDILQTATPEFERILIQVALAQTKGRKGEAAELLGWGRNTLTRKIQQLNIKTL